jgi:hypothetical protein
MYDIFNIEFRVEKIGLNQNFSETSYMVMELPYISLKHQSKIYFFTKSQIKT